MILAGLTLLFGTLMLAQGPLPGKPSTQVSGGNCSVNTVSSGAGQVIIQMLGSCGNVDPQLLAELKKLLKLYPQTIENLNTLLREKNVNLEHADSVIRDLEVEAEHQRAIAQARQLASEAEFVREDQPELSALLAIESIHHAPLMENDYVLRRVFPFVRDAHPKGISAGTGTSVPIFKVNYSSDGGVYFGFEPSNRAVLLDPELRMQFLQLDQHATSVPPADSSKAYLEALKAFNAEFLSFQKHLPFAVAFSSDGKYIAAAYRDGIVRVFESADGERVGSFANPTPVQTVAVSSNGRFLLTTFADGTIQMQEISTGKIRFRRKVASESLSMAGFSPDDLFVAAYGGKSVQILSTGDGDVVQHLTFNDELRAAALSLGAKELSVVTGTTVRVVSVATMQERWHSPLSDDACCFVKLSMSPDSRFLALTGQSSRDQVLDMKDGRIVFEFARFRRTGATAAVFSQRQPAVFTPDGRYVAFANRDNSVSVVDLVTGSEICNLIDDDIYKIMLPIEFTGAYVVKPDQSHPLNRGIGNVLGISFGSDRKSLVAAYGLWAEGTKREGKPSPTDYELLVKRYEISTEEIVSDTCARISRNLSESEWKQYLGDEPYKKTCPTVP